MDKFNEVDGSWQFAQVSRPPLVRLGSTVSLYARLLSVVQRGVMHWSKLAAVNEERCGGD